MIEMPFRALPQYEFRAADVGGVAKSREDAIGKGDLLGSPEVVFEVLSASNRPAEIATRASLFLATGTQQFCVVDDALREVRVTGPSGKTFAYAPGQQVPFPVLGISLPVDDIFS